MGGGLLGLMLAAWACVPTVGCSSEDDPDDWEALAEASGFPTEPTGFFDFAQQGCHVLLSSTPASLNELAAGTTQIVTGRIAEVVTREKTYTTGDEPEYHVQFLVVVEHVYKGSERSTLLVNEICSHGAKVAGLRHARPEGRYLFLLDGPWQYDPDGEPLPEEELGFGLAWYKLGVVADQGGSLELPYRPPAGGELLDGFSSLEELADDLANRSQ